VLKIRQDREREKEMVEIEESRKEWEIRENSCEKGIRRDREREVGGKREMFFLLWNRPIEPHKNKS
jgi:hypothetical protein